MLSNPDEVAGQWQQRKNRDERILSEAHVAASKLGYVGEELEKAAKSIAEDMKAAEAAARKAADAAIERARAEAIAEQKKKDAQDDRNRQEKVRNESERKASALRANEGVGMALAEKAGAFGRGAMSLYEYTQGRGTGLGGAVASFARRQGEQMGLGSVGSGALGLAGGVAGGVAGAGIGMGVWALGKAIEPLSMILEEISGKLNPLNILREALNAPTSGTGVFGSSVKLLGTVVSGLLMPAFLGLSAATIAYTRLLDSEVMPQLMELAVNVLPMILNAAELGLDGTLRMWRGMKSFADWLEAAQSRWSGAVGDPGRKVLGNFGLDLQGSAERWWGDYQGEKRETAAGGGMGHSDVGRPTPYTALPPVPGRVPAGVIGPSGQVRDTGEEISKSLKLAAQEYRFQLMPKAAMTDIASASRQAQMAALNASPIEREQLQALLKIVISSEETAKQVLQIRGTTY